MSTTVSERPVGTETGPNWQAVATGSLAAFMLLLTTWMGLAAWTFTSNMERLQKTTDRQGDEIAAVRKEIADTRLELTKQIDAVDKNLTATNGKIDLILEATTRSRQAPLPPR